MQVDKEETKQGFLKSSSYSPNSYTGLCSHTWLKKQNKSFLLLSFKNAFVSFMFQSYTPY